MEEKIRAHVESLFAGATPTQSTMELKEEILQNVLEHYHDLLFSGKTPEQAYKTAIRGIGDISGLIQKPQPSTGTFDAWTRPAPTAPAPTVTPTAQEEEKVVPVRRILWIAVLVIYLIISFMTGAWEITWLVLPIGFSLDQVLRAVIELWNEKQKERGNKL